METWKKFTKYKESAKIYIEINKKKMQKNAKKCKKMLTFFYTLMYINFTIVIFMYVATYNIIRII